jgi:hypothetical protein
MVADYMDAKVAQRFGGRIKRSEAVSAGLRFVARRFAVSYAGDSDLSGVKADLLEWLDQMIAEEHSRKQLAPRSIANGSWSIWPILLSATGCSARCGSSLFRSRAFGLVSSGRWFVSPCLAVSCCGNG